MGWAAEGMGPESGSRAGAGRAAEGVGTRVIESRGSVGRAAESVGTRVCIFVCVSPAWGHAPNLHLCLRLPQLVATTVSDGTKRASGLSAARTTLDAHAFARQGSPTRLCEDDNGSPYQTVTTTAGQAERRTHLSSCFYMSFYKCDHARSLKRILVVYADSPCYSGG